MSAKTFHGSDVEKIEEIYGISKDEIVSFAANVNPVGMSPRFVNAAAGNISAFKSYPDREYTKLRAAIGEYCKVNPAHIIVGSGATELISATINTISPRNVLVLEPTYSEYVRRLELQGAKINSFELLPEDDFNFDIDAFLEAAEGKDLIMICNPNNPTGGAIDAETIVSICRKVAQNGCKVLIDETYVEFTENIDEISAVTKVSDNPNLIILRGTSKFFDAPGLRLGYMVCANEQFLLECKKGMDPWSVNALAAEAAGEMFGDNAYIKFSKSFIRSEMKRLIDNLESLSLHIYPACANIVLIRLPEGITSKEAFEHCIRQGLMIRDCASFKGLGDRHIRLCISSAENNDRIINALADLIGKR